MLPSGTHYAVLPDFEGKRVGSGGATLGALRYIHEHSGGFDGKRILVIHSGGDSKRVPQYSACGKLFSPVPRELPDGRRSTLFDEFMIAMSGVPSRIELGMLVLSSDVLLLFNPLQIDFFGSGAVGMLNAVLKLFPLDAYVPFRGQLMHAVKGDLDGKDPDIWQNFTSTYTQNDAEPIFETLEREEFYKTAQEVYAVIRTGETAPYANIILKKSNNCD